MPDPTFKVLVTGSSGLIGGVVMRTLGDKYTFSGLIACRRQTHQISRPGWPM